ncbi:MAG: hypothetical protein ACI841_000461 [Planctomycetota bacterium]|jgi:hypothetical protein
MSAWHQNLAHSRCALTLLALSKLEICKFHTPAHAAFTPTEEGPPNFFRTWSGVFEFGGVNEMQAARIEIQLKRISIQIVRSHTTLGSGAVERRASK